MVNDMLEKGLSPRTVRLTKSILTGSLRYALKMEYIKSMPNTDVDIPVHIQREIEILTPEQADLVFQCATQSPGYVPLMVLFQTMMRRGELCGLKRGDIDFVNNVIYVNRHLNYIGGVIQEKLPKNNKQREILMSDFVKDLLIKHINSKKLKDSDWLFTTTYSNFLPPNALARYYRDVVEKIERETNIVLPTSLHAIRHFVISQLISNGVPIEVVSQMAGHTSIAITSRDLYAN